MAKKLVSAQDILAEKGYVLPKFDTDGFNNAVIEYFRANGPEAELIIRSRRFVENPKKYPPCGWLDFTTWDENLEVLVKIWYQQELVAYEYFDTPRSHYIDDYKRVVERDPCIYVDEPFCKNAVHMLAIMQGFVVKSRRRKGIREYIVSLL